MGLRRPNCAPSPLTPCSSLPCPPPLRVPPRSVCMVHQLEQLGLRLPPPSLAEVGKVLMDLWAEHGDCIANQVRQGTQIRSHRKGGANSKWRPNDSSAFDHTGPPPPSLAISARCVTLLSFCCVVPVRRVWGDAPCGGGGRGRGRAARPNAHRRGQERAGRRPALLQQQRHRLRAAAGALSEAEREIGLEI